MWDEGIRMARTAYLLDAAIEIGDSRRVKEIARSLSEQVKAEVSAQAEAGGWYEEYDRLTELDAGLDKPVREWYEAMYPNDASVMAIAPGMTFSDMLTEVVPYGDLAGDVIELPPVVRNRVLDELSVRSGVPHGQIADAWRNSHPEQPGGAGLEQSAPDVDPWLNFSEDDVEVRAAAWAMDLGGGRQALAECHLTSDEDSPWGFGFYFAGFVFEPEQGEWVEQDGGLFWGFRRADDPELAFEAACSCDVGYDDEDFTQIDYDTLYDCGIYGGDERPLTPGELGSGAPDDAPGGCDLDLEAGDAREAQDAVNGPADRANRDPGAR